MSADPLTVPAGETGVVRVFSLEVDDDTAQTLRTDDGLLPPMLGLHAIDADHVEVVPVSDLAGVGMVTYLVEGQGISEADLSKDIAALEALTGHVAVIRSSAIVDRPAQLAPGPELTFVAAFSEERPEFAPRDLTSEAARPYSGAAPQDDGRPGRSLRTGSALVALMLILVLGLIWWILA